MSELIIRQSGGASIISLPKSILGIFGLHVGSTLNLAIKDNAIVLTPATQELTLEELLTGSPKHKLCLTTEDREWMQDQAMGKELL